MKLIIQALVVLTIASSVMAAAASKEVKKKVPEVTITGYLVDDHCAKKLMEKNDVAIPAKQHERSCAMMPECSASGYGVFVIVNKSATHASDVDYYRLNDAGNKMAKAILEKSKKKDDILVTVNGKGTIAAETVTEVK